jgi:hypothetical protein
MPRRAHPQPLFNPESTLRIVSVAIATLSYFMLTL